MASGNFETKSGGGLILRVYYNTTTNTSGNYSSVSVRVYVVHRRISVVARSNSTIYCGGQNYSYKAPSLSYTTIGQPLTESLIGTHTFTVPHEPDGTKAVTLSASWAFNGTYGGVYTGTMTTSKVVSLDTIPRQSSIDSIVVDANNLVTIKLNKYLSTCLHTVSIAFGDKVQTLENVDTQTSFQIPLDWWIGVPNSATAEGKVTVKTLDQVSGSQVGHAMSVYFKTTLPESYVPSIVGVYWTKSSNEPEHWPITQDVSKGTIWMSAAGCYGSTITSYSLTFAGLSSTTASLAVTNIATSGTLDAVATVTDSRGRTATLTVPFTVVPYCKPIINATVYRSDADGNEDASGDYMTVTAGLDIANIASNYISKFALGYKQNSSVVYTEVELDLDRPLTVEASSNNTWNWVIIAGDAINTVTLLGSIPTGQVVMDILADGSGIAFGKVSEEGGIHSNWDYTGKHITAECVYTPRLVIGKQDVVDHVIEVGTKGIWTYRRWSSGIAECWGSEQFGGSVSASWGSLYYLGIQPSPYPISFADYPIYHITPELNTNYPMWLSTNSASATKLCLPNFRVVSPTSVTVDFMARYYVIGKWK